MKRTITIQCPACKGTGICNSYLQIGFVCSTCLGRGKVEFSYEEFEGLKRIDGIKRVFVNDPISNHHNETYQPEDSELESGEVLHFSKFGCKYEDFLKGEEPKPMEELYCPNYYDAGHGGVCSKCRVGLRDCGYGRPLKCLFWKVFQI